MKKTRTSLRTGFLMTILICWLVPIFIVVALAGVLLNENYRQSVQQEIDSSAANALRLVQMRFEDAIDDSKAVSYDGTVRDAYRTWLQNGDSAGLYGTVTDYLSQSFTRGEIYQAVFIHFWNVDASAYVLSDGTTSFGLLRQCRECAPQIMAEMEDADTDIRLLLIDGQMYMARNLLDSTFTPYASVVMLLQPGNLFLPLDSVNRVGNLQYSLDGYRFTIAADGSLVEAAEEAGNVHYQAKTETYHRLLCGQGRIRHFRGKSVDALGHRQRGAADIASVSRDHCPVLPPCHPSHGSAGTGVSAGEKRRARL